MLFLLACTEPADTAKATVPEDTRWTEADTWALAESVPCPADVPDDDAARTVTDALGIDFPIGIDPEWFSRGGGRIEDDPARLSWFAGTQSNVAAMPCFAHNAAARAEAALASTHPLTTLVADAAGLLDRPIQVGGAFAVGTLAEALDALGASYSPEDLDAVPADLQTAAAQVLVAEAEAIPLRDGVLDAVLPDGLPKHAFDDGSGIWLTTTQGYLDPNDADYAALYANTPELATLDQAAARVTQAVDEVDWAALATDTPFSFTATTEWGDVLLRGGGADTYDDDAVTLLAIDAGGDDTWLGGAGATASKDNPFSVALDLGGDDVYGYTGTPSTEADGLLPEDADGRYPGDGNYGPFSNSEVLRQGAGDLGLGLLVDLGAGRDSYASLRRSQGYGQFGVGLLWDDGGDDTYAAEAGAQGAGIAGIGLLVDVGGADTYTAWNSAQGFAWVSSAGLLLDGGGDDAYTLVPEDPILYPSSQLLGAANSNCGQGTAFGYRDETHGEHLAGGVALLDDLSGDDTYVGATYVQGTSYWIAAGLFVEGAGDDTYSGEFYAQGAAVHYSASVFLDEGGDDRYDTDGAAVHSMIGLGHDFGATVFVDAGGDDVYEGPDRSIGAAKCHGLSLFVDRAGDDAYSSALDRAMGWATDYDIDVGDCDDTTTVPTTAIFVDLDGVDTYDKPHDDSACDGCTWTTDDGDDTNALELSGGIDTTGGRSFAE